jgi:hypothetical protein
VDAGNFCILNAAALFNQTFGALTWHEETPSQLNSKPTAAFLQKLKSLNLPVTVSITAAPITPTKKPEPKNVAASNKSSQKLCAISTVISSTTKNKNVIEIMGNTVTNTCRWCGQVFHRLYLFKNHLKVRYICRISINCSNVPYSVHSTLNVQHSL